MKAILQPTLPRIPAATHVPSLEKPGVADFEEALARAETAIVAPQVNAARAVDAFAKGAEGKIHETLITMEKADISMRFMVSVRNKVVDAYREIMRMGA